MARPVIDDRPAVLVVDDEPNLRLVISRMLQEAGFSVVPASSGNEALQRLTDGIDVAVLDIRLPGLSGPEVARRAWTSRPSLPILFVSGFPEPAVTDPEALGLVQHFLRKPFTPDQLVTAVSELLAA
jgi:two-component system cell cycle sensor histidine kinase/response regulator CckA